MTAISETTGSRFTAFDELVCDDRATLDGHLRAALAKLAGVPDVPVDWPVPFLPIPGVETGYRVPHAIGNQLFAALPPDVLHGSDRRGPAAVHIDARRITRSPQHCRQAVARLAGPNPGPTDVRRGVIEIQNFAADLANMAAAIAEACGPAVGGVVLANDFQVGDRIIAALRRVAVPGVRVWTTAPGEPVPRVDPGRWVVVPPGCPAWADGHIADPPIIVAAVPFPACHPAVRGRLFARPDQTVLALAMADQGYTLPGLTRLLVAYGGVAATCPVAGTPLVSV